jgi:hypothetical protein
MDAEVVMNLWVFIQVVGPMMQVIYELGVRPYMMRGTDDEMLAVLKALSISDFHLARRFPLPDRYYLEINNSMGEFRASTGDAGPGSPTNARKGLALVNPTISGMRQMEYFKEALDAVQASLPTRRLGINGDVIDAPTVNRKNLLSVITGVGVDDRGNQHAQVEDARRTQIPPVATNLWMFRDEREKAIFAMSGRGYMIHGTENEKARVLKALSPFDYAMVDALSVPERFAVPAAGNPSFRFLPASSDNRYSKDLFQSVFETIERQVPKSVGIDGKIKNNVSISARSAFSTATLLIERKGRQAETMAIQVI